MRHGGAASCCVHTRRTAHRRSSRLQGIWNASERTHEGVDRVHGVEAVASAPLQPEPAPQVDMDALRNLRRDGREHDAAAAARRCSDARSRSPGNGARHPAAPRGGASRRSQLRNSGCRGRTACTRPPTPGSSGRQTLDGCPRWRSFAIEDWTRTRSLPDTAPSRRRGLPRRVLKEARPVITPAAGLPSCTGSMVAAPCSDQVAGEHPRHPAASAFAAVAANQSQELRSGRWNQNQLRPPESGGSTPPSTAGSSGDAPG